MHKLKIIAKGAFYGRRRLYRHDLNTIHKANSCILICANCHRVRDLDGSWFPLKPSLLNEPSFSWSHTICLACAEQLYGKESWYQEWLVKIRKQ